MGNLRTDKAAPKRQDGFQHSAQSQSAGRQTRLPLGQELSQWQPEAVLSLQRSVGNQVVQRMLASRVPDSNGPPVVQAKLSLGPVADRYEAEADRIAQQVSSRLGSPFIAKGSSGRSDARQAQETPRTPEGPKLQRFSGKDGGEIDPGVERQIRQARGGGRTLDNNVRQQMEGGFGQDFQGVRIHADARADSLSRSLNARAFTTGSDIFFKRGEYNPGSGGGKELLAHELTHVVQQTGGAVQRWPWSKKNKNKKDKTSATKTPSPYNPMVAKFMPGSKEAVDPEKLAQAQEYAGSVDAAIPDYSNPKLAGQAPERHVVTVAVAQEEEGWWDAIKSVKKIGIKKLFQSPRKLFSKIKEGDAEEYLLGKMLKYKGELPANKAQQAEAIERASDLFHSVGHTWVRLATYVGGEVKDLYSYGFWPRLLPSEGGYEMNKYVPGQVRHPDVVHEDDKLKRYYDKTVKPAQFTRALSLAQNRYINPPAYHLLDYNCTKFAREILEAAGRSYPGKGVLPEIGFSPGELYAQIGKRKGKNKSGKQAYETDPLTRIIESVTRDLEERTGESENKDLEEQGLAPRDPKDYPEGIYQIPITDTILMTASRSERGALDQELYFMTTDKEALIYVEKDMIEDHGRAYTEQFGQTFYFPVDRILSPGMTPTHQFAGDSTSSSEASTASTLPYEMTKQETINLIEMGEWEMAVNFGYIDHDRLENLTDEQYKELADLLGKPEETIRKEVNDYLR